MVPLEKAIDLVLEGADITDANKGIAKVNFLEAFEEGQLIFLYSTLFVVPNAGFLSMPSVL